MKFALCNECCQGWTLDDAIRLARDCGYHALEIAPFTLAAHVADITPAQRDRWRTLAENAGLQLIGLHWLLVSPTGLSLNGPDPALRRQTTDYLHLLIDLCADLGGDRMVIGSPKCRNLIPGLSWNDAWNNALDTFRRLLPHAAERHVTLCIEPLARYECNFITTVREGLRLCQQLDSPWFRLHLDVKAMCDELRPLDDLIRQAAGFVAHLHVNDQNRNGPGWGDTDYAPIVRGLADIGYDDVASVEVFDFSFSPHDIAARSIDFLQQTFTH